ncbi:hypothetical protein BD309DRAFT_945329 [Dichomitus squalens]|uniref:Protein BIG1 n=1 Tax=Dichomitus squalens TaxID=114155 RepID=A0A4Q9Q2L1_9APHY|nr:uncharacterized protein DICSQDRAFT_160851 [Dichomitus squalens LYAD-421 SS1]EJF63133.1 hypothetical protein DICSQDRAFT_160851 [Dichomitus squalens LYAD-421 SS1]TBU27730.1 hypothetical protein BD311DRAFT_778792 [Dichomitus squalens]TBU50599.1 hypothetical protein BD309DRAFT_945329 [Dichomitus squalens]TBU61211.1 hypothetical protein BD310DRAFT_873655 [Dichomitus squalens]
MAGRALTLLFALLPAAASAYSRTHPVLAWSSRNSRALTSSAVSEAAKNSHAIASALYTNNDICDHDAVIVVNHQGLHASDLRTLSSSCHVARALSSAPSSLQFAYVESEERNANPFLDLSSILSERCGSRAVSHAPDLGEFDIDAGKGKHVVSISLPALEDGEIGASRKSSMANHESWLSGELSKIENIFSDYLVIYAGAPGSSLGVRQSSSSSTFDAEVVASPSGGILKRYQLLTPGLILVLLVSLFILVPVIFLGVSALSSIQSPLTNEIPKGFSAEEKKNQ